MFVLGKNSNRIWKIKDTSFAELGFKERQYE